MKIHHTIAHIYRHIILCYHKKKRVSPTYLFRLLMIASTLINFYAHPHIGYRYPRPIEGYYSQKGQDKFLNEVIFNNKQNGIFVEVGAHDGISFSNSYFFEKNLAWTGICVEPNPNIINILKANRSCICEHVCISDSNTKKPFLLCSGYMLEMYSGLLDAYDPRHLERIEIEMNMFGGEQQIISVDCCTLQSLFEKYKLTHIDFLSIDIEGGEKTALQSIDFSKVVIDVIVIENNFNETILQDYLKSKDYIFKARLGKDDIYVRKGYNYGT